MEIPKRKQKIFDCFLYWDEKDLLLLRLSELYPHVTYFLIIEFDLNFKLDTYKEFSDLSSSEFDSFRDKIIHLKLDFENSDESFSNISSPKKNLEIYQKFFFSAFEEIKKTLKNFEPDFEDIVMFSDVDEVPDLEFKQNIFSSLVYGPVILKSHNFVYTTKFYQEYSHLGTQIFYYSMIIRNGKILYDVNQCKIFDKKNLPISYIKNGWHLSHFNVLDKVVNKLNFSSEIHKKKFTSEDLSELIHNLSPISELQSKIKYKKTDIQLPKNIFLIDENKNFKIIQRKHFVSVGNQRTIDGFYSIRFINFTDDPNLPFEKTIGNNIFEYNIMSPKQVLYNSDEFTKEYKLNDIKLVLNLISPLDDDLITIETENGVKEFCWGDIKNSLIYDIL